MAINKGRLHLPFVLSVADGAIQRERYGALPASAPERGAAVLYEAGGDGAQDVQRLLGGDQRGGIRRDAMAYQASGRGSHSYALRRRRCDGELVYSVLAHFRLARLAFHGSKRGGASLCNA